MSTELSTLIPKHRIGDALSRPGYYCYVPSPGGQLVRAERRRIKVMWGCVTLLYTTDHSSDE